MERYRRRRERGCFFPMDMSAQITRITRLHRLAEVERLLENDQGAKLYTDAAVSNGVCVLTVAERDKEKKIALEKALEWLRSRDYEMHKTVQGTLDQASAKRALTRRIAQIAVLSRGGRNRRNGTI